MAALEEGLQHRARIQVEPSSVRSNNTGLTLSGKTVFFTQNVDAYMEIHLLGFSL